MKSRTKVLHSGIDRDLATGASSIPIYHGSTFHHPDVLDSGGYFYSRASNPTRDALEKAVAELEGGTNAFAFASGVAAISAAFMIFKPGDHLVVAEDIYGGTLRLLRKIFSRWGLLISFVDGTDTGQIAAAVTPETVAVYVETPSNPLLNITDLAAVGAIAREKGILAIIDNTFCTPYLQQPFRFGFDIILHSATKFLNGHSDVLAGLAVVRDKALAKRLREVHISCGAVLGVQESWLLLRGLRTLAVRMEAAQANAEILARELQSLPGVRKVYYPTLPGHPGRAIHMQQASGGGAVISFELDSGELARSFLKKVMLPIVGVSLGGVESLLSYPVTMSHATVPEEERLRHGITDGLVRFSVGLEDPEDILEDFTQALQP